MTRDNLEDKMFHSIIINFKMGHKSINVRNRCMCFSNISQNATYRNQLIHSLDYVQTRPIARQMLFPGGARRIVRKRLGLLNFTWGSWKLCVGSPTVSNFSKLVSTPESIVVCDSLPLSLSLPPSLPKDNFYFMLATSTFHQPRGKCCHFFCIFLIFFSVCTVYSHYSIFPS